MDTKVLSPKSTITPSTFPTDDQPRLHSLTRQLSLPKKNETNNITNKQPPVANSPTTPPVAISTTSTKQITLANHWREIQGSKNWKNLVKPNLHPLLREEIIKYGEFVNACYKAFDLDPNSKRYLNCKYGKKKFFKEIKMENSGYNVTKYIYATPNQNESAQSRWIGYVAVSSDEHSVKNLGRRDIVITFRGTITNPEWIENFKTSLTPARLDPQNPRPYVKVESGFLSLYTSDELKSKFGVESCREQLLSEVSRLLNKYKGEELSITIAGHSMGSALALLLAYDIAELGFKKDGLGLTVFSFGGPRVGNLGFKQRCEELGVKILRVVNVNDPITKMPGVLFNENFKVFFGEKSCYAHVGVELALDFFNMKNPSCVHDLESYINLLRDDPATTAIEQIQRKGMEIFSKVKETFDHEILPSWIAAATNVLHLVQSNGIMI
ncbi:hypothetical protein ACFE04_024295 [Oxalis oulophora]